MNSITKEYTYINWVGTVNNLFHKPLSNWIIKNKQSNPVYMNINSAAIEFLSALS